MSQENVERPREFFEAWSRNDAEAVERMLRDFVAPDVEIDPLYLDQVYTGIEGFREMWADIAETWEDYRLEVEVIIDPAPAGDWPHLGPRARQWGSD